MKLPSMIRRIVTRVLGLGIAGAACILSAAPAQALNIAFAGAAANNVGNQVTQFYTQTTPKTLDADGDDRYGSAGYDLFGLQVNQPAYNSFAAIGPGIAVVGPFGGYTTIDNPGFADAQVRTTTNGPGAAGSKQAVITYQINNAASIPNGFRIGILTDGLDSAGWSSQGIYVEQTAGSGGGSAFVNVNPIRNNTIDMVFFDITDAQNGDQYRISVNKAPNNAATLQGVVFDTHAAPVVSAPAKLWSVDIAGGPTGNGFGDAAPQAMTGGEISYGAGNIWNQYFVKAFDNSSPAPAPLLNLVDSSGAASSVNFQIIGNVQGWTGDGGQGTDPLRRDYLFLDAGQSATQVTWELTGLDAGGIYELYAYGGATRSINLLIDQTGEAAIVGSAGFLFENIIADSFGRITGIAGDGPVGGEQNWSGFQLRKVGQIIPEPATMSLLALASVAMLRRRRGA